MGQGGKREASSFVDTDVTSCEHLHLNSFSWIRDVWKRVSRFTSEEKSQTIPSYFSSFENDKTFLYEFHY